MKRVALKLLTAVATARIAKRRLTAPSRSSSRLPVLNSSGKVA